MENVIRLNNIKVYSRYCFEFSVILHSFVHRTCTCNDGCNDADLRDTKECDKPCVCLLTPAVVEEEIPSFVAVDIDIGYLEKDGTPGQSSANEVVQLDDKVDSGNTVYIGLNNW